MGMLLNIYLTKLGEDIKKGKMRIMKNLFQFRFGKNEEENNQITSYFLFLFVVFYIEGLFYFSKRKTICFA